MEHHSILLTGMVISVLLVLGGYLLVCIKDGSSLNWLTPSIAIGVPSLFVLPYLYTVFFGSQGSIYAHLYCSSCYMAGIALPALAYRWIQMPSIGWSGRHPEIRWMHWLILILAAAIYAPVLIEFRAHLLDPRFIYQETRRGYGPVFFGSAVLLNIAAVLFFFRSSRSYVADGLFWLILIIFTLEHGSKGELLDFFWVWMFYRVYVNRRQFGFVESAKVITVVIVILTSSFVIFGIAQPGDLLQGLSKYADYTRNASLVIDDANRPVYFGLLSIEDNFYSRMPRVLFPNKPKIYGTYRLMMRYFSGSDWLDVGSPDFGVGIPYADFGPFALVYIGILAIFNGLAVSCVVRKLKTDPNPGNLVLLVFFSGIQLIPLGVGYMLPETILLSWFTVSLTRLPRLRIGARSSCSILNQAGSCVTGEDASLH